MLCLHCGHENEAGRKSCRACVKPLAPEATPSDTSVPTSMPTTAPAVNKMAVGSLALSLVAFFVPFGIASLVMGHMSRTEIAKSNGRQTGTGIAFAGLIISYLQLAVVALIFMSLASTWQAMNHDPDLDPYTRAALVSQFLHGGRNSVALNRQNAIDALRLVHARQNAYLAAHPSEGYACQFHQLEGPSGEDELNLHVANSHYEIQIYQCRGFDAQQYVVVAVPRSDANPQYSPVYCLDQTGVIRRSDGEWLNETPRIFSTERRSCPQAGEQVQ